MRWRNRRCRRIGRRSKDNEVIQNYRVMFRLGFRVISEVEGTVTKLANDLVIAEELSERRQIPIVLPEDLQVAAANRD